MAYISPEVNQPINESKVSALVIGGIMAAGLVLTQNGSSSEAIPPTEIVHIQQAGPSSTSVITTESRASINEYEKIFGCEIQSDMRPDTTHQRWANKKERQCAQYIAGIIGKNSYGWGAKQQKALIELWTHESNWSANADNPISSAYGIPQAMTSNKLHGPELQQTFGDGAYSFYANPVSQIQWGLDYIHRRYGNPVTANAFWRNQCGSRLGCWY